MVCKNIKTCRYTGTIKLFLKTCLVVSDNDACPADFHDELKYPYEWLRMLRDAYQNSAPIAKRMDTS